MSNNTVTGKKRLMWDTIFSTYWWEMELNPSHPDNAGNSHLIVGYSKAQGQTENQDKHQLLLVKLRMFIQRGWIQKTNKISIYHRLGSFIEKTKDTLVLELVPNDFSIYPEYKYDRLALSKFLKTVYHDVFTGKSVEYLLPLPKQNLKNDYSKDDRLDINKYFFKTFHDLQIYCERLSADGFPIHVIKHFLLKYCEKYPELQTRFNNKGTNAASAAYNEISKSLSDKFKRI